MADALAAMHRIERSMKDGLPEGVIAYYDGKTATTIRYKFDYTKHFRTMTAQDFAKKSIEDFVSANSGKVTSYHGFEIHAEFSIDPDSEKGRGTETERIYVRISPELKARLQKKAQAEDRSVSNYIKKLIMEALEN